VRLERERGACRAERVGRYDPGGDAALDHRADDLMFVRMCEIIQILGAGGLVAPSYAELVLRCIQMIHLISRGPKQPAVSALSALNHLFDPEH
jgi:hypothetical protein